MSSSDAPLAHHEFVARYKAGRLAVHVNQSAAMHVCDSHPKISKAMKFAHHFWKNTGCLVPLVGVGSFFFIKWYWALAIIFFGAAILIPSVRRSATGFILDVALTDEAFYDEMIERKILSYSEKP